MSILRLQHTRSDGEVDTYHLKQGRRYHIGRGSACEVRILDMRMSRQHCAIEWQADGWVLVDLGSTNGCMLDGKRVVRQEQVKPYQVVEAGSTRLEIASIGGDLDSDGSSSSSRPDDLKSVTPSADLVAVPASPTELAMAQQSPNAEAPIGASDDGKAYSPPSVALARKNKPTTGKTVAEDPFEDHTLAGSPAGPMEQEQLPQGSDEWGAEASLAHDKDHEPGQFTASGESGTQPKSRSAKGSSPGHVGPPVLEPQKQADNNVSSPLEPIKPKAPAAPVKPPTAPVKPVVVAVAVKPPPAPAPLIGGKNDEFDMGSTLPAPPMRPVVSMPMSGAPTTPAAGDLLVIKVLGVKIGPIGRAVARELKARELKGTLKAEDLAQYPKA